MAALIQEFAAGTVLDGRYEVTHLIGSGGMGNVYAANRLALGDVVAIKQLRPMSDTEENRSRLLVEARAAAHIRHPNVVKIFDFGQASGGSPYFVMEHLKGIDLGEILADDGPMSVQRALELFGPICAAVEAGHRRGVIHRDIKPGNVFLDKSDDGRQVVKVLDFGLAVIEHDARVSDGLEGPLLGTPQYMAAETIRGEPPSPSTDVFALGVLLFHMLTCELPFDGSSPIQVLQAITQGVHRSAIQRAPHLPSGLSEVIDRALDSRPQGRPESPEHLARLAERAAQQGAERAAQQSAERAAQQGAERAAQQGAERAAQQSAEQAAQQGAERAVAGAAYRSEVASSGAQAPHAVDTFAAAGSDLERPPNLEGFVGRVPELAQLHQEYARAISGEGRWVLVGGEPGLGKTRLVERFVEELSSRGQALTVWGRFFDDRGRRAPAYETFRDMLQQARTSGSSSSRGALTLTKLGSLDSQPAPSDEGEENAWRIHASFADNFATLAGSRPLILILDDLQWASRADLALLDHLQQALTRRGTLLIATLRPVAKESSPMRWRRALASRRASVEMPLSPFTIEDVQHFLQRCFGSLRIHPLDVQRLHRVANGNPYFMVEVLRLLLANGTVVRDGSWHCASLEKLALPSTITHLIEARLGDLDGEVRRVLEVASVMGDSFRFEALSTVTGIGEAELETMLDGAVQEGVLKDDALPSGSEYGFASEAVRRVLYGALSSSRRRRLHGRMIEALVSHYGENLAPLAPSLANHHAALEQWSETFTWGLRAARRALELHDVDGAEAALSLTKRAIESMQGAPPVDDLARFEFTAGVLDRRMGRLESSKGWCKRALGRVAGSSFGDRVQLELALCQLDLGELEDALRSARDVVTQPSPEQPRKLMLRARMCEASVLLRLGRAPEAASQLDVLLAMLEGDDSMSMRSRILRERAWADLKCGKFGEAEQLAQRSLEKARVVGDLWAQRHALSALAAIQAEAGDIHGSLPYHRRALDLSRRLSLRRREGIDLANIGEAYFRLAAPDQALEHFQTALEIFVEIGDRACQGDCQVNIGRTLLSHGKVAQALETLATARQLCESTGRSEYEGIAWLYEGEAHLRRREIKAAREAYEAAWQLFTNQSSYLLWRAEVGMARTGELTGDSENTRRWALSAKSRLEALRDGLGSKVQGNDLVDGLAEVESLLEGKQRKTNVQPTRPLT